MRRSSPTAGVPDPASISDRVRARAHRAAVERRYRRRVATSPAKREAPLRLLLGEFELPPAPEALAATSALHAAGWFDLLGSGWRPFHTSDSRPSATSMDWHVDVLSGHRWSTSTWYADIDRAPGPGIDVKLPWELGRLQHLPRLALAYRYATEGTSGFRAPAFYANAIDDQLVDFVRQNPVGFGVQWACAMDVSIRMVNILLAYDILATGDSRPSDEVRSLLGGSIQAHGRFVVANLEWTRRGRTNHYLADLCGLAWAGAHLETGQESDSWLCLAARELQAETALQFDRDGVAREGSTSYHRLSAEMVVWTTALLLSLTDDRLASLRPDPASLTDVPLALRRRPTVAADVVVNPHHLRIVSRMPDLPAAISRAGSHVSLIGDNDSGRFVNPAPTLRALTVDQAVARYRNLDGYDQLPPDSVYWWEDSTDHSHLRSAAQGLFGSPDGSIDGALVNAYVRRPVRKPSRTTSLDVRVGASMPSPQPSSAAARRETLVAPGGNDLLQGLVTYAFVDFGLYVWRSHRIYLTVRCGPVGQDGRGGHDHLDQLSVELFVDGIAWFVDPGNVTYTRDIEMRNAYRSAGAHAVPFREQREDWGSVSDLFQLGHLAVAGVPRYYGTAGFSGACPGPDGEVVRTIELLSDRLVLVDLVPGGSAASVVLKSAADAARLLPPAVPFSPGYGWQHRDGELLVEPDG
ncbi:MAG TPA: heparinase II/III family protein [Acidimicrobiales bacterium]|nr:heparinase II/III family protein [Acidimicrobiales bacterium]